MGFNLKTEIVCLYLRFLFSKLKEQFKKVKIKNTKLKKLMLLNG